MKTESIKVEITPQMKEMLGHLVSTGLYGMTIEDSARRLIELGLTEKIVRVWCPCGWRGTGEELLTRNGVKLLCPRCSRYVRRCHG